MHGLVNFKVNLQPMRRWCRNRAMARRCRSTVSVGCHARLRVTAKTSGRLGVSRRQVATIPRMRWVMTCRRLNRTEQFEHERQVPPACSRNLCPWAIGRHGGMGEMSMPLPDNTVPMRAGVGAAWPAGRLAAWFSVVKVLPGKFDAERYEDPGWYETHRAPRRMNGPESCRNFAQKTPQPKTQFHAQTYSKGLKGLLGTL